MTESFNPERSDGSAQLRVLARQCLESRVAANEPRVELPMLKNQGAVFISKMYEGGQSTFQIAVYNYEPQSEDSLVDPELGFAVELNADDEIRVFSHPFAKNTEVVDATRKQEIINSTLLRIYEGLSLAEARLAFGITQAPAAKRHRFQRWFSEVFHRSS